MAQQFPLNLNKKNILSQSKSHSTSTTFDDKSLDHRSVEPLSVGQVQRCTLWPNWNLNQLDFTASFQGRLLGDSSGLKKIGSTVFFFFIITQCTEQNWQRSQSINICARYITCVLLRDGLGEPNKHAAIQREGGAPRCLYAPNKRFLQLIECESGYSAHRSSTQLLNSSPFDVIRMEELTPTKCILTGIQQPFFRCQKNGDQIEFGSLLIPPIEQRRGVRRENSVQHLLWISHSLQRHCSPWHWFLSFTCISVSLLSDAQIWRLMFGEVFFNFFFLVLICNEKINESFQVVKRFLSPLWIKPP